MKNLNTTATKFVLSSTFIGDGKYYTTQQGSRKYNNTTFQNFANRNSNCLTIISKGNDAPQGGKAGDFVVVKFTPEFLKTVENFLTEKAKIETKQEENKNKRDTEISSDIKKCNEFVDAEYRKDVENSDKLNGQEKSKARAIALKNLLSRYSIEIVHFYDVMRAI